MEKIQNSIGLVNDGLPNETYQALLFTTKSTVETTQFLLEQGVSYVLTKELNSDPIEVIFGRVISVCGGNDVVDARAITAALDHIVKLKFPKPTEIKISDVEDKATRLSETFDEVLRSLLEYKASSSPSVTYSSLAYPGGYITNMITDAPRCAALLRTNNRDNPLYKIV